MTEYVRVRIGRAVVRDYAARGRMEPPFDRVTGECVLCLDRDEALVLYQDALCRWRYSDGVDRNARRAFARLARSLARVLWFERK